MKRIYGLAFALLATLVFLCSQGFAEEQKPVEQKATETKTEEAKVTGNVSLGIYNRYVWRGFQYGKNPVFQPSISVSYYGFTANLWGNIDTREKATQNFVPDRPDSMSFNETDLTLSYTYAVDKLSLTGGWYYYGTKYVEETHELFLTATYDVISKPTLSINRDIAAYPGTYFNLSFSHSVPVYREITFDLGASFGYWMGDGGYWKTYQASTGGYTGSKYSAFHDGMVRGGFTIPVTKSFALQPVVQYWFPLSGDAKRVVDGVPYCPGGNLRDTIVFGLGMTFNF